MFCFTIVGFIEISPYFREYTGMHNLWTNKGGIPETSIGKTKDTSLSLEIYGKISQINEFSSKPSANLKEFLPFVM